jgi:hypothetical protein
MTTRLGDSDSFRFSDGEYIGGATLTQHLNQMKLSAFVAIAAVIGGSFLIQSPADAQYYGQGYGFNNRSANSYGPNPYARSNQRPAYSSNNFQPTYRQQRKSNNCSSFSMSNYGC